MPALPIAERELRVTARKAETYWSRPGVVLGLGLLWIPALMGTLGTTTEINTFVFNGMLWAGFGVSCVAFLFTADSISRERREGTLGLLFLSRVRVVDVLLGKLGSSGFKGLCMLAAFLPMLMIPVLAGGVTPGEAAREGLVLLNTFWFSLCAGLWASSRSTDSFTAIRNGSLLVGAVVLIPFFCLLISDSAWYSNSTFNTELYPLLASVDFVSPLTALHFGRESFYKGACVPYWLSLGCIHVFSWLLVSLAGLRVRRFLREFDSPRCGNAWRGKNLSSQRISGGYIKSSRHRFSPRNNPVDWLVRNQRGIRTTLWIAATIEILYFASTWGVFRGMLTLGWPSLVGWAIWFFASASTDALFARAGSRFFYESKRSGQLETLLTTPLGPRGVMEGQWSALKKLLVWPVVISLAAMLWDEDVSLITEIGRPGLNSGWVVQCIITWGIDIAGSILGILAVSWFGMLFALKGKSAAGIILRAAALGTGVPALFKTLYALGAERITFTVSSSGLWPGTFASWLEEFIVIFYYLWLFRLAKNRVLRELSGLPPVSKKPSHASRITRPFAPQVTPATMQSQ